MHAYISEIRLTAHYHATDQKGRCRDYINEVPSSNPGFTAFPSTFPSSNLGFTVFPSTFPSGANVAGSAPHLPASLPTSPDDANPASLPRHPLLLHPASLPRHPLLLHPPVDPR